MQSEPGHIHVFRLCRGIEPSQDALHLCDKVGADFAAVASFKKSLQAAMSKVSDHS